MRYKKKGSQKTQITRGDETLNTELRNILKNKVTMWLESMHLREPKT
jgi:hypothetical protein